MQRGQLEIVILRLTHLALHRALATWVSFAEFLSSLRGAVLLLHGRRLLPAWATWTEAAAAYVAQQDRHHAARALLLARLLRRWCHRLSDDGGRLRRVASDGPGARGQGPAGRVKAAWGAAETEGSEGSMYSHRELCIRAAAALRHRTLGLGFQSWTCHVASRRSALDLLTSALRRMRSGSLGRGLTTWRAACQTRRAQLECVRRVVSHLVHRATASGFHTWVQGAQEAHAHHGRLRKGLSALRAKDSYRALRTWHASATMLSALSAFALRLAHRGMSLAWNTWRERRPPAHIQTYASVASWRNGAVSRAVRTWLAAAREGGRVAALVKRAMEASSPRRACERVWDWWALYSALRRLPPALIQRIASMGSQSTLRRVTRAWAGWALSWSARRIAAKHGVRSSVWYFLNPEERCKWPKAWLSFFGWRYTWRDVREWLEMLPLGELDVPKRHQSHAGLVVALQQGHLYLAIVQLIEMGGGDTVAGSQGRRQVRVRMQLEHRAPPQERDNEGGWRHLVRGFLRSERVKGALGEAAVGKLCASLGSESERLAHLGLMTRGDTTEGKCELLIDHLQLLCALRVVHEMSHATNWAPYVASLSGPDSSERMPKVTKRHPADDYSASPAGSMYNYVCLGCPSPRILREKVR